jgi:hypothetical protein
MSAYCYTMQSREGDSGAYDARIPGVETTGNVCRRNVRHHAGVVPVAAGPGGFPDVRVQINGRAHASSENTLVILADRLVRPKPVEGPKTRESGPAWQLPMNVLSVCGLRQGP